MVVGALHVECIAAFEAKYDPILIVDPHGVEPSQVGAERVQSVPGRHFQVVEPRHRVDLIQLAADDRPQILRDPAGGFRVDAVPDVPGRVVG